jgi:ABC-2 type transport system ATP-binding protein
LRRRVEIARALLVEPRLLLLDEPTVGLDVAMRRSILAYVRGLCRDRGLAVLWSTHLLEEVSHQDAIVVLERGRILAKGLAQDVIASSKQTLEQILA